MKFTVRGNLRDLLRFIRLPAVRKRRIRRAPVEIDTAPPVNRLSQTLHPRRLRLVVDSVRRETADTRTYRLISAEGKPLPFFRAGQYLSFKMERDGVRVTRPYSLSSTPSEALNPGFYEVTIKLKESGFVSPWIFERWAPGTPVETSSPLGQFTYEPLRDGSRLLFIAGGCGITPFRPLISEILAEYPECRITLLYGITDPRGIIFRDFLESAAKMYSGRLAVRYVCSGPDSGWDGERGLIDAGKIIRHAGDPGRSAFYLCGSAEMYRFLDGEIGKLGNAPRRIRKESPGDSSRRDIPSGVTYELTVEMNGRRTRLPARSEETVLVALERAGLSPPSECRSGECGFCRARLLSGEVFVLPDGDGRRAADLRYGYIHPCASYPESDLTLAVPPDPTAD